MKSMVPDGYGSVVLGDVREPVPTGGEAVVAVDAYSINRGETFLLERPQPGWRPGKDIAGTVVRAAASGSGPAVGERVVGHPPQGGWAERVVVSTTQLAVLPENVTTTTAAALPLAGLTALRVLRVLGSVAGRRILPTGASGGVGHYIVELAAAQGAAITAVTAMEARGRRLLDLGAAALVPDVDQADGQYDIVIESIGGDVFPRAFRHLTPRGLFIWMGQASRQPLTVDFFDWTGGASGTIRKFHYADSDVTDGEDLQTLVRLVSRGRLHPEIDRVRGWHDTPAVLKALINRETNGKAILEVAR